MADSSDLYHLISKLQFHYWFSDKSHTMDALVHNKCERELLELTKVVAKICGVTIKMETEPSGKGGLKSWLTVTAKTPRKTPVAKVALVNTLLAACMATPGNAADVTNMLLDRMLLDKEMEETERGQLKQAMTQLKSAASNFLPLLDQNSVLKKRRSNFYELLRKYQKVKSISITLTDDTKKPVTEEQMVVRDGFKNFKISFDTLTPQQVKNAQIEIISPVLVKGRHKWKGMYDGAPISFIMKSDDFMADVQSGKVEFKSGSTINCTLEIEKKITAAGTERIIGYNILGVSSYSENEKTIDATENKQKVKPAPEAKRQLDLFG